MTGVCHDKRMTHKPPLRGVEAKLREDLLTEGKKEGRTVIDEVAKINVGLCLKLGTPIRLLTPTKDGRVFISQQIAYLKAKLRRWVKAGGYKSPHPVSLRSLCKAGRKLPLLDPFGRPWPTPRRVASSTIQAHRNEFCKRTFDNEFYCQWSDTDG